METGYQRSFSMVFSQRLLFVFCFELKVAYLLIERVETLHGFRRIEGRFCRDLIERREMVHKLLRLGFCKHSNKEDLQVRLLAGWHQL